MTHSLEIRLLGPFEVAVGGRPVDVSGSKRHGLLALLALRCGRVVGVDELIDALWGEQLPAAPRNALQHHVARLRAVLGQEAIVASDDGYALVDAAVDALRFEELLGEARVAMREGDAAAAAESIALGARPLARSRAARAHGYDMVQCRGAAAGGAPSRRARRAVRGRARAWRASGDRVRAPHRGRGKPVPGAAVGATDAGAVPQRPPGGCAGHASRKRGACSQEELGLEPGPDLQRLQAAILAHDPAIAAGHGRIEPRKPAHAARRRSSTASTSSRDVVELLREHRLVTLTGPPGVGQEPARRSRSCARWRARCVDGVWLVELARAAGAAGRRPARRPSSMLAVRIRLRA